MTDLKRSEDEGASVVKQPEKGVGCQMEPATYQAVAAGLIEGRTVHSLAEEYEVSPSTVSAIRARHIEAIPTHKQRMATKLGIIAETAANNLQQRLDRDEISERALPVVLGVSLDKQAALLGETPVTTVRHVSVKEDNIESILDRLPRANATILDSETSAPTTQTTGNQ